VSEWLDSCDSPSAWLSLDKQDNDFGKFLSYLLAAVETIFPHAVSKTMTLVNAPTLPPLSTLAGTLVNDLDRIEQPFILVLDDFHVIKEAAVHNLIAKTLKHPPQSFHLVIVGRRDPPLPISTLRAQSKLAEIRTPDLRFSVAETEAFLNQVMGIQIDPSTVVAVEEKTEGWVTGLRLAALSMRDRSNLDPRLLEPQVDAKYVMEYLFEEVFSLQPPGVNQYLLGTAILDRFCGPLCDAVCRPGVDPFTCELEGRDFINWLEKENLFLIHLDAESRWFRYHHLFKKLLLNQLKRIFSVEEINVLHTQASAWFAENGLIEEALKHALAAKNTETAASLIARFSHQMMNDQQWVRLERCLSQLSRDQIEQNPALLVLEACLHHIRHNFSGVAACLERIEALNAASAPDHSVNIKDMQGLFEAMKGALHHIAAEAESAVACLRRALKHIPVHHKRALLFAHTAQILTYQMVGDFEIGLSIYQKAMERHINRDNDYHAMYLGKLGLAHWMEADLTALQRTAESIGELTKNDPLSFVSPYYRLYFMGIIHYHRNELQHAEEKLAEVVKAHYTASPINFAHAAFALALTYQAQGKSDQAREISRSVVVDSIQTNNEDMLRVAGAFEAELVLRQGRLADASRWVEKYQAKPFLLTFRFYMPQLTAVKILMAQATTDSRRRAADFLDQLHDFLESIHNNRFRIDALAFQALLHNAQGEHSVALEKLTAAINLAQSGGFIRLFVDLGPQMADLLKQLIEQNVAADYIGRILAAFKEDEDRAMPGESDHLTSQLQPSNAQTLAQPLTNRELQILNMLGQWLQNKEIAAKLYISPLTVKKHLDNIYGKLNISGRRQAVEKAQRLGILPPH
jgi:LuxR family maltose regulon positive regulatory protein